MASDFWAKQVNDIAPEHLADVLMALSTEGFTDWQILAQTDETQIYPATEDGPELRISSISLYRVLAWGRDNEDDETRTP